jgi:hypothetical protein
MAENRSEKSNYPSRYSPSGWVSAYQYITELVCENSAKQKNKELPVQFWELPEWKKFFKNQIITAVQLVKKYGAKAVVNGLNDRRAFKTYSLRSPVLKQIIAEYKEKEEMPKEKKDISYDFKDKSKFASNNEKKSIISKLRDLE